MIHGYLSEHIGLQFLHKGLLGERSGWREEGQTVTKVCTNITIQDQETVSYLEV